MKKTICVSCDRIDPKGDRDYGICDTCEAVRLHVVEKLLVDLKGDEDLVVTDESERTIHVRSGDFCVMITVSTPTKLVNCCDPDGKLDEAEMPWCESCQSYHVTPKDENHKKRLGCRAKRNARKDG